MWVIANTYESSIKIICISFAMLIVFVQLVDQTELNIHLRYGFWRITKNR